MRHKRRREEEGKEGVRDLSNLGLMEGKNMTTGGSNTHILPGWNLLGGLHVRKVPRSIGVIIKRGEQGNS